MSQKITSKNLHYTSTLPPFLARLRGQADAETDPNAPDPILSARRRPGKPRSGSAEVEDAPLVVDEHGNAVSVALNPDGSVKAQQDSTATGVEGEEARNGSVARSDAADDGAVSREKLAGNSDSTSRPKKRRVAKVVGADADEEDDAQEHDKKGRGERRSKLDDQDGPASSANAKAKRKAKKIKLSFGDDEG
jgi:hypothetical protein